MGIRIKSETEGNKRRKGGMREEDREGGRERETNGKREEGRMMDGLVKTISVAGKNPNPNWLKKSLRNVGFRNS